MPTEAPRSSHWYRCPQCQQHCLCSDWRAFDLKAAAWGMDYAEALISLLEAKVLNQGNPRAFDVAAAALGAACAGSTEAPSELMGERVTS